MTTATLPLPQPHHSASVAWLTGGAILAATAITFGVLNVVGLLAYQKLHFATALPATIRSVDINNDAGHVHVFTATSGSYRIEGNGVRGLSKPTHHEQVANGRLVASAECRNLFSGTCDMNLDVYVPAGVAVHVRASGGGITLTGAVGNVDASSSGGGVTVDGARGGDVRLHSSGGSVNATGLAASTVDASSSGGHVELAFDTAPNNVHATSSGGHVTVTLPHTSDLYRVSVSSSGGSTHDNVRTDPTSDRTIDAHSSGGGVTVQYPQ